MMMMMMMNQSRWLIIYRDGLPVWDRYHYDKPLQHKSSYSIPRWSPTVPSPFPDTHHSRYDIPVSRCTADDPKSLRALLEQYAELARWWVRSSSLCCDLRPNKFLQYTLLSSITFVTTTTTTTTTTTNFDFCPTDPSIQNYSGVSWVPQTFGKC